MKSEIPQILYKYRSLETETDWNRFNEIISDNLVYFSKPSELNDPFEGKAKLAINGNDKEKTAEGSRIIKKFHSHLPPAKRLIEGKRLARILENPHHLDSMQKQHYERLNQSFGILSLSANPFHPLMWSMYAASHKGICMGFSTSHSFFSTANPVEYSSQYPTCNILKIGEKQIQEDLINKSLFTKANFWEYENEWRVIMHTPDSIEIEKFRQLCISAGIQNLWNPNGPGKYFFPSQAIKTLYLGANISHENRRKAIEIVRKHGNLNIEIIQTGLSDTEYKVEVCQKL